MNLKDLEDVGAFVDDKPVKRTIEWKPPGKQEAVSIDVYIKMLSGGMVDEMLTEQVALASNGAIKPKDRRRAYRSLVISKSVFVGTPPALELMPYEKAYQLRWNLMSKIFKATEEVNDLPREEEASDPKE